MPKAASAANSQAKQCALAIVAAFGGREPPLPEFESVCYSMLARGRALSIHGRFRSADAAIRQIAQQDDSGLVLPDVEAQNANRWYRNIVRDSFGA
jgi:sulfide dehydrogenase [flavocytochrome c] flavoprotein subunit